MKPSGKGFIPARNSFFRCQDSKAEAGSAKERSTSCFLRSTAVFGSHCWSCPGGNYPLPSGRSNVCSIFSSREYPPPAVLDTGQDSRYSSLSRGRGINWRMSFAPPFLCRESPLINGRPPKHNRAGGIDKCTSYQSPLITLNVNKNGCFQP